MISLLRYAMCRHEWDRAGVDSDKVILYCPKCRTRERVTLDELEIRENIARIDKQYKTRKVQSKLSSK